MSTAHHQDRPFPGGMLVAAASMVGLTLLLTAGPKIGLLTAAPSAQVQRDTANVAVAQSRDLRFEDRSDGSLAIIDAVSGAESNLQGEHGFIRGVLRGLARERRARGIDAVPPFRLTLWANGRLSLTDMATARTIELDSFGPDNRKAFATLLASEAVL